jgi:hypothetical protein
MKIWSALPPSDRQKSESVDYEKEISRIPRECTNLKWRKLWPVVVWSLGVSCLSIGCLSFRSGYG